jgi:hypothetical protein
VWLVSNGFHSSLAFRASDVPELAKLTAERRPSYVLIGWGEADFYRFPSNALAAGQGGILADGWCASCGSGPRLADG